MVECDITDRNNLRAIFYQLKLQALASQIAFSVIKSC